MRPLLESDVTFVIVPTPSGADHFFTNNFVVDAIARSATRSREKRGDHLVVVTSTVMPGSTGGVIQRRTRAELRAHRRAVTSACATARSSSPSARVIRDLLHPDMVLIGECIRGLRRQLERDLPDRHGTRSEPCAA